MNRVNVKYLTAQWHCLLQFDIIHIIYDNQFSPLYAITTTVRQDVADKAQLWRLQREGWSSAAEGLINMSGYVTKNNWKTTSVISKLLQC